MINFVYIFGFAVLGASVVVAETDDLPASFPKCPRDIPKPELDKCMVAATETVRPLITPGIRKLGFPPLNPLVLPLVTLEQGSNSASYKAYVKNLAIHGLADYKFKKLDFDFKAHTTVAIVDIPNIYVQGIYVINGKILSAPIEGEGTFKANLTYTVATLRVSSKIEKRNGVTYLHHYKYDLDLQLGHVTHHSIEGLFEDNEILAKATQATINDNIKEIVDTIKPAIVDIITSLFKNVYFKKLDTIPYDILFPLSKKQ